ncbi:hypothetical protein IE81DRAFT_49072 [Ceraceosorus guamensis]|uniref:Uncharacterized protein n=1 Tax=Ceraceosorus guamensis TaxID=1522189 RepID=A0A316VNB7_9BASI|nr:hypothetical protein IE81DRAFT_49072 [Ceraceosorus guamensis]PWN39129.1 hypothetical protein IE81DRAFT_49072 [Ceraceosorus guamensis]
MLYKKGRLRDEQRNSATYLPNLLAAPRDTKMTALRVCGLLCLAIGILSVAALPRQPASRGGENGLGLKPASPCTKGLHVWVRADDLRPSSLVEGEARLVNNLTHLAHDPVLAEQCRIVSWTLGLRHRERVALKYPVLDVQPPQEPQWNYTWSSPYRWGLQDELSVLMPFSPSSPERNAYEKRMQEYADAMANREQWIVAEKQRLNFEAVRDMGAVETPSENLQVVELEPFLIAVPPVIFPPRVEGHGYATGRGSSNVSYARELDMAYFAQARLAGGDIIKIAAGQTTSVPPPMWSSDPAPKSRRFHHSFNESSWVEVTRDLRGPSFTPRVVNLEGLNASLTFESSLAFVQGDKRQVQGEMLLQGDRYHVESAHFKIVQHVRPVWASSQLLAETHNTRSLEIELLRRVGLADNLIFTGNETRPEKQGSSRSRLAVPLSVEDHLRAAIKQRNECAQMEWSFNKPATAMTLTSHANGRTQLSGWANISDSAPLTTSTAAAFENVEAYVVVEIILRDSSVEGVNDTASGESSRSDRILEKNYEWDSRGYPKSKECLAGMPQSMCTLRGSQYRLTAIFEGVSVLPRGSRAHFKTSKIRDMVREQRCKTNPIGYLSPEARAPMFVEPKQAATAAKHFCSNDDFFPRMNATTTSRERRPAEHGAQSTSDSELLFVSNRWQGRRLFSHEEQEVEGFSWTTPQARTRVGKVWAEKVILPEMDSSDMDAQEGDGDRDTMRAPPLVIQNVAK